ncbi:MAG: EVE domain-containing protein [Alphaproteobacteria bacterium]
MAYWLMKSEPDVFGWDQLVADGVGKWDGVRNYQARNNLAAMRVGDEAFFYHSNIGKAVVGICRIIRAAYPDDTFTPPAGKPIHGPNPWVRVDVVPVKPFATPVTLDAVKANPHLSAMALVKATRLSVQPVTAAEWQRICTMGGVA